MVGESQLVLSKLIRLVLEITTFEVQDLKHSKWFFQITRFFQMKVHRESVFAVRDTELIQFPARLLHHIKRLNPVITEYVIGHISRALDSDQSSSRVVQEPQCEIKYKIQAENLANISTIAIVCSDENCSIDCFIDQLKECLSPHGKVICLSSSSVEKKLGRFALTDRGSTKAYFHFYFK